MIFVLFFIYDLFICHRFTQPCSTTAVGTSVPALRLSLIGRKSRGAFVSATLIGQTKKIREWVETDFTFLRTYSVNDLCVYRKTCTYTLRKL